MRKSIVAIAALGLIASGCSKGRRGDPHVVNQTYVHRYGVEVTSDDWESRGKHGVVITKLDNGVVVSENYNSGVLEGVTTYTYPHSDLVAKSENYVGGNLAKEVAFDVTGSPQKETLFQEGGVHVNRAWFDNGVPQCEERYSGTRLIDGEYYDGEHKVVSRIVEGYGSKIVRDEYGNEVARDTIEDGLLVARTGYYPNGAPKEIFPYVGGNIQGIVKRFLPVGEPAAFEKWVAGCQHGITTIFQNGEKFAEVPYVKGIKSGVEKRFRDGSSVVEEITWAQGKRHGPTTVYIGSKSKVEWFFKDSPVTKAIFDLNAKRKGQ